MQLCYYNMKYFIIVGGVLLVAVSISTYFVFRSESPATIDSTLSFQYKEEKMRWQQYFDGAPVGEVYAHFLETASALDYYAAHGLSHIIGEELYDREGWEGIAFCTQDFGFGCFHGFSGAALSDRGLGATEKLSAACTNLQRGDYLGCIHGIGHGILAYVGNDNLVQALVACESSQQDEVVGGCFGGVIMEYNYNTMQSQSGIDLRPFSESDAYSPCGSLGDRYTPSCYYELPSWWYASFEGTGAADSAGIFTRIGKLCSDIQDEASRTFCFRGTGNVVGPRSDVQVARMKEWCDEMPTKNARDLCYAEELGHLLNSEDGTKELRALCESKTVTFSSVCGPQR